MFIDVSEGHSRYFRARTLSGSLVQGSAKTVPRVIARARAPHQVTLLQALPVCDLYPATKLLSPHIYVHIPTGVFKGLKSQLKLFARYLYAFFNTSCIKAFCVIDLCELSSCT